MTVETRRDEIGRATFGGAVRPHRMALSCMIAGETPATAGTAPGHGRLVGVDVSQDNPVQFGDPRLPQRFWSKVQVQPNGCWHWTRALRKGYGAFGVGKGRVSDAHLHAYRTLVGAVPPGYQVDHVCHTLDTMCVAGESCLHRRCVNPSHLEAVTILENNRRAGPTRAVCADGHSLTDDTNVYMYRGGRCCRECRRKADRNRPPRPETWNRLGRGTLTAERVREMRALIESGVTLIQIAQRYEVSQSMVSAIKTRRLWSHVE